MGDGVWVWVWVGVGVWMGVRVQLLKKKHSSLAFSMFSVYLVVSERFLRCITL